jgi:hypothetical protein
VFRSGPMMPVTADNRRRKHPILRAPAAYVSPVTAEVAGSSPVVPAILFSKLEGWHHHRPGFCDVLCDVSRFLWSWF